MSKLIAEGDKAFKEYHYRHALKCYLDARKTIKNNEQELRNVDYKIAKTLIMLGYKKTAFSILDRLIKDTKDSENRAEYIQYTIEKAQTHMLLGEYNEGMALLKSIIDSLSPEANREQYFIEWMKYVFGLSLNHDFEQAEKLATKILAEAKKTGEGRFISLIEKMLGEIRARNIPSYNPQSFLNFGEETKDLSLNKLLLTTDESNPQKSIQDIQDFLEKNAPEGITRLFLEPRLIIFKKFAEKLKNDEAKYAFERILGVALHLELASLEMEMRELLILLLSEMNQPEHALKHFFKLYFKYEKLGPEYRKFESIVHALPLLVTIYGNYKRGNSRMEYSPSIFTEEEINMILELVQVLNKTKEFFYAKGSDNGLITEFYLHYVQWIDKGEKNHISEMRRLYEAIANKKLNVNLEGLQKLLQITEEG